MPGTTSPALETQLQDLETADLETLRGFWEEHFGSPLKLRSPDLLRHLIAWRLQAAAHGGLDRDTRRKLNRRGATVPEGRQLGVGAILRRTWNGQPIEVIVEQDGFRWNDESYPSLSAVARAATGTRWNGPRFFGLREGAS